MKFIPNLIKNQRLSRWRWNRSISIFYLRSLRFYATSSQSWSQNTARSTFLGSSWSSVRESKSVSISTLKRTSLKASQTLNRRSSSSRTMPGCTLTCLASSPNTSKTRRVRRYTGSRQLRLRRRSTTWRGSRRARETPRQTKSKRTRAWWLASRLVTTTKRSSSSSRTIRIRLWSFRSRAWWY